MNKRLKCIIVDDEPMSIKLIKSYVENIPYLMLSACFEDATEARQYMENNEVDILYSDIQMPGMTGLELVKSLPNPPYVILISGFRDFAPEGFEIEAIDYLVKPFSFARFEKATNKIRNIIIKNTLPNIHEKTDAGFIFIKLGGDYIRIFNEAILYFKANGDFLNVVLSSGKTTTWRESLNSLEDRLPLNTFVKVHRSYIVNLQKISKLLTQSIILSDNTEIPISESYQKNLKVRMGIR